MDRWTLVVSAIAACVTSSLALHPAGAFSRRLHVSTCNVQGEAGKVIYSGNALFNFSQTTGANVFCPVLDDTNLPKENVHSLTISGEDRSTQATVLVAACLVNFDGTGASCDPAITSGPPLFTGVYALAPTHPTWNATHARDLAFIQISLPADPPGQLPSSIRGFQVSD